MNDDQLRREIEEALSVEPSLHFAAQVRARIAESSPPSWAWIRWAVPAAGFALVALVTAVMFLEPKQTVIPKPVEIVHKAPEQKAVTPPIPTPQPPVTARRAVQPSPAPAAEPEVLFDPREMAAFRSFVEGVPEDRIDIIRKLIELQEAAARTAPIEEIALMPIGDFEPIVIESLTFGARRIEGGSL